MRHQAASEAGLEARTFLATLRPMRWLLCLSLLAACGDDPRRARLDAGPITAPSDARPSATSDATAPPPSGSGGVGDPCTVDTDCVDPPDLMCMRDGVAGVSFPGGFCTKACGEGEDPPPDECGSEGVCATLSMSGGGIGVSGQFCTTSCESTADCRASEGYTCRTILSFGVCGPPGL